MTTTIRRCTETAKVKVTKVTLPMLNQMLSYAEWAENAGWFYGNQGHFRRRHKKVMAWLEAIRTNRLRKV